MSSHTECAPDYVTPVHTVHTLTGQTHTHTRPSPYTARQPPQARPLHRRETRGHVQHTPRGRSTKILPRAPPGASARPDVPGSMQAPLPCLARPRARAFTLGSGRPIQGRRPGRRHRAQVRSWPAHLSAAAGFLLLRGDGERGLLARAFHTLALWSPEGLRPASVAVVCVLRIGMHS